MNLFINTVFKVASKIRPCNYSISNVPHLVVCAGNINYTTEAMKEEAEEGGGIQEKSKWLSYNDKIYPPILPGEEQRPAVSNKLPA